MLYAVAVFAPLLGSIIAGLLGRQHRRPREPGRDHHLHDRCRDLRHASFIPILEGHAEPGTVSLGTWVDVEGFHADWALRYDTLSAVMVAMVTFVATLIHIYSVGYMSHDATIPRFFSYLSLFTFAMLMLVTADNLLQLFFGWEGVGLASYLLIGYWYDRPSACAAAIKAFVVNRVGDLFFAVGIALVFFDVRHDRVPGDLRRHARAHGRHLPRARRHLARLRGDRRAAVPRRHGQVGADRPAHLAAGRDGGPDAGLRPHPRRDHGHRRRVPGRAHVADPGMRAGRAPASSPSSAPRPRCSPRRSAASQNDIKRIIAYSTCSQLGYMFIAAGVGAYQVSIFHLITHAFFKALLFLGAGSVIHAMSDEQDIRNMGGIWRKIPITYVVMWIGSLALAGIPIFAGYYSKDAILEAAWARHTGLASYGFWCGTIAAFLTAFYSWRLLILTFHGAPRADHHTMEHVHESPWVMLFPLIVLAVGATLTGIVFERDFIGDEWRSSGTARSSTARTTTSWRTCTTSRS